MDEKAPKITISADKIKKVEDYVERYQKAFRDLQKQLPDDGRLEPHLIATVIGRLEIYPCRDAAIVLTYADDSDDIEIEIKDSADKTVLEFIKNNEIFTYFDEDGNSTSIGISFSEDVQKPNHFLHKNFNMDDVVAWSNDFGKIRKTDGDNRFFRPRFKRLSILGWESPLSDPKLKASEDIQKAYVYTNILKSDIGINAGRKGERLLEIATQYMLEFDDCLKSSQPNEKTKEFLKTYPEIIHPAFVRCYKDVVIAKDLIVDFLLLIWDEELKCFLVKLGDVNTNFFANLNDYSENSKTVSNNFSEIEKQIHDGSLIIPPYISSSGTVEFHFISGRTANLNYLQKKHLRAENKQEDRHVETYDDLGNQFKFIVKDVAGIWDRYEPIQERLEKLGILNDIDFNRTMELIDQEMRDENISIPASSLEGWLRFSSVFGLSLTGRDPLSVKIYDWFDRKYGDDLKIDPTWKTVILIGETIYRLRIPFMYGTINFICSPENYGITSGTVVSDNIPTINILDLIDDFTKEQAEALSQSELANIVNQFQIGSGTKNGLDSLPEIETAQEVKMLFENCVNYLLTQPIEYQLVEQELNKVLTKLCKAFISQNDSEAEMKTDLNKLITKAEFLGLREVPRTSLEKIRNLSVNRSDFPSHKNERDTIEAYYIALDICSGISSQIFLTRYYKQVSELEPGKFYTNSLGKIYRCIEIDGDIAKIMLFDEMMGKTLEVLFTQHRDYWDQYYLIEDQTKTDFFEEWYRKIKDKDSSQTQT